MAGNLTVTLRHNHTPYHTMWSLLDQAYWYRAYKTYSDKYCKLWWFFIWLKSHLVSVQKCFFSVHFLCTKFQNLYFRFTCISSKEVEWNFRGSSQRDFRDQECLVPWKSILTSLAIKCIRYLNQNDLSWSVTVFLAVY